MHSCRKDVSQSSKDKLTATQKNRIILSLTYSYQPYPCHWLTHQWPTSMAWNHVHLKIHLHGVTSPLHSSRPPSYNFTYRARNQEAGCVQHLCWSRSGIAHSQTKKQKHITQIFYTYPFQQSKILLYQVYMIPQRDHSPRNLAKMQYTWHNKQQSLMGLRPTN